MKKLIAVDWGTTSLRGALLGEGATVLEEQSFPRGILSVQAHEFPAVFDECFGAWMREHAAPALMCGMVGSKQGWMEAPYCACPAGFAEIAAHLAWVVPGRVAIVPGLNCERAGIPDVMRGEETQIFGALQTLGLRDAQFVLPGTHSKWVLVRGGRIEAFTTCMTGEVYALLRQHSILSRTMPAEDGALDGEAFDRGVALALQSAGLLQTAFSARTLALFERMPKSSLPSYLSGLVIGEELRSQRAVMGTDVIVIGAPALTERYERALRHCSVQSCQAGSAATWRGLWAITCTIQPAST